jgi:hypothetical protein
LPPKSQASKILLAKFKRQWYVCKMQLSGMVGKMRNSVVWFAKCETQWYGLQNAKLSGMVCKMRNSVVWFAKCETQWYDWQNAKLDGSSVHCSEVFVTSPHVALD